MKAFHLLKKYVFSKFSKIQLLVIVAVIFFAFIISETSIFARLGYDNDIRNLKNEIEYYKEKSEEDKRKLGELRSNKDNVEKFARENYLMKKENEEIFIIE